MSGLGKALNDDLIPVSHFTDGKNKGQEVTCSRSHSKHTVMLGSVHSVHIKIRDQGQKLDLACCAKMEETFT